MRADLLKTSKDLEGKTSDVKKANADTNTALQKVENSIKSLKKEIADNERQTKNLAKEAETAKEEIANISISLKTSLQDKPKKSNSDEKKTTRDEAKENDMTKIKKIIEEEINEKLSGITKEVEEIKKAEK